MNTKKTAAEFLEERELCHYYHPNGDFSKPKIHDDDCMFCLYSEQVVECMEVFAAYAAVAFAEWCRKNYCTIDSHNYPEHKKENSWYIPGTTNRYTTDELYQLWQQSL